MNKFPSFDDVKTFYNWGCYTNEEIHRYVELGSITKEEYTKITGEPFSES
ncbi:XkdX family protein [Enterococcus sp. DIV0086]